LDAGVAQRLGGVQLLRGDYSAARSNLRLATKLDPLNPAPWLTLEYLYQQTGDAGAAADAYRIADRLSARG
jgi:Tfp pilus assembly protein PilF